MAGVDPDLLAALQINDEESTDEKADQGNEIPRDDQRAEGQDEVFRPAPDSEQLEGVVKGGPEGAVNDPTKASGDVQGVGSPPPRRVPPWGIKVLFLLLRMVLLTQVRRFRTRPARGAALSLTDQSSRRWSEFQHRAGGTC